MFNGKCTTVIYGGNLSIRHNKMSSNNHIQHNEHQGLVYKYIQIQTKGDLNLGGIPGNSWWGCAARFSKSTPYFRPKNVNNHTRFQAWPLRNYVIISSIKTGTIKRCIKIHFEVAYFSFFLTHLELKRWIRPYPPVVPSKIIPDSRPNWANSVPKSGTYYMAYVREFSPPGI